MKKFYCNGKKDFCEDHDRCSKNCRYFDSSGGEYREVHMTNADRIRAMTDDEIVNWIADIKPFYCQTCVYAKTCRIEYDVETVNYAEKYDCKDGILKWLQLPGGEVEA